MGNIKLILFWREMLAVCLQGRNALTKTVLFLSHVHNWIKTIHPTTQWRTNRILCIMSNEYNPEHTIESESEAMIKIEKLLRDLELNPDDIAPKILQRLEIIEKFTPTLED